MTNNNMEVCVVKPTKYDECVSQIIDLLLDGKSVVVNLEGVNIDVSQRIIDTVSGGCYAMQGHFTKISSYIHLFTPNVVDITGDLPDFSVSEFSNMTTGFTRNRFN